MLLCIYQDLALDLSSLLSHANTNTNTTADISLAQDDDRGVVVIDASISLCTIAAKNIMTTTSSNGPLSEDSARIIGSAFHLSQELLQSCVVSCPYTHLPTAVHLLGSAELVLGVLTRIEGSFGLPSDRDARSQGSSSITFANQTHAAMKSSSATASASATTNVFKINESHFTRDGILLSSTAILGPLIKFILKESQRRRNTTTIPGGSGFGVGSISVTAAGTDVEDLVAVLQRSENHILACRVLLFSWLTNVSKAQVLPCCLVFSCCRVFSCLLFVF